jgi:putative membrane protein
MRADPGRLARSALLLGLALLIAKLLATGQMVLYMSPALDPLSALAAVLLTGMGVVELRGGGMMHSDEAGVDHALTYLLVLLPLLLGLLVTPRALGSSALGGESASALVLAFAREAEQPRVAPSSQPIEDVSELLTFLRRTGQAGIGQPVRAIGLVARSADLAPNEFVLLRYSIVHCVADARPIALLVVSPQEAEWSADQWVEIEGSLGSRQRAGDRLVSIIADRIVPAEEPSNPYLQAI